VDSHQFGQSTVVLHAPLPDWLDDECGFATIHPDGGVLILPTTPRGLCRVVAQVDDEDLPRWRSADPDELQDLLGGRDSRLGELDVQRYTGSHVYRLGWQHAQRYVAPGLALVGDAAHVTHPNGGQGMTLAVYDAAALGQVVAPALLDKDGDSRSLTAALWEYAARRRMPSWASLARANRVARFQRKGTLPYAGAVAMLGLFSISPSVTAGLARRFGGE
jgi:2-octaprenylphenol hydroxylase